MVSKSRSILWSSLSRCRMARIPCAWDTSSTVFFAFVIVPHSRSDKQPLLLMWHGPADYTGAGSGAVSEPRSMQRQRLSTVPKRDLFSESGFGLTSAPLRPQMLQTKRSRGCVRNRRARARRAIWYAQQNGPGGGTPRPPTS